MIFLCFTDDSTKDKEKENSFNKIFLVPLLARSFICICLYIFVVVNYCTYIDLLHIPCIFVT